MLAARGVSLGLGKINLSDLNQLPHEKHRHALLKREEKKKPPRIIIKKKADAKWWGALTDNFRAAKKKKRPTVWAACRAVIFGCIVIAVGLAMTILGYFDKHFSERITVMNGVESVYHDKVIQIQLKSMQYLGPVLMGVGSFILIVACVVTLESRDKHAQIITEDAISLKRKRLMSVAEENVVEPRRSSQRLSLCTTAEIHRPVHGLAPLADEDSLDLHSCSSEVLLADPIDETYRVGHSFYGSSP